jgi:hypothetical protein
MGVCRLANWEKEELKKLYNYCCAWCGVTTDAGIRGCQSLACDHVETAYAGGSDVSFNNFQILCGRCNSIKGAYSLDQLLPRQPCYNLIEIERKQYIFKTYIMPMRRLSPEGMDYPRNKKKRST